MVALWQACGLVARGHDAGADFRRARAGASSAVLVAEDAAGRVLGSVMVGDDGHRGWLYYLASHPAARQRGIGRQLVAAAEAWLAERGVPKAMLLVDTANGGVLGFYRRLGFEPASLQVMRKPLDGKE